jgi:hypothetical protein
MKMQGHDRNPSLETISLSLFFNLLFRSFLSILHAPITEGNTKLDAVRLLDSLP